MSDQNEKITIIGPSMGGLIARYALAYMEKNVAITGSHNCKLYISQDAPHLGANIPIGIQALIRNLSDGYGIATAEDFLHNKLDQPATKELLLSHIRGNNFGADALRYTFIQNQNNNGPQGNLGWPKDPGLQKIAIVNGSLTGKTSIADVTGNGIERVTAGGKIFEMDVTSSGLGTVILGLGISFAGGPLLGILSAAVVKSIRSSWEINYTPGNGTTGQIFKNRFYFRTLFGGDIDYSNVTHSIASFNQGISLDAAPGGLYNAPEQVFDAADKGLTGIYNFMTNMNIGTHKKYASFIPTKSALGFHWNTDKLATNLGEDLSNRNLVCTGEIPFNDYFQLSTSLDENTEHIKLNQLSALFISQKMGLSPPPIINYTVNIEGPKGVQTGSNTKFTALYQGNFQFFTKWSIEEKSGISASITYPDSPTCEILTGNGTGSENGYFVLKATTTVKLSTGEMVCAGSNLRKVYVRKLKNIGSIDPQVCTYMNVYNPIILKSGRPPLELQPNGVKFDRPEWTIANDPSAPYGPTAHGGTFTIHSSGVTNPPPTAPEQVYMKGSLNTTYTYQYSTVQSVSVKVVGIYKLQTPEYGEIEITSARKDIDLQVHVQPNLPSCLPHNPGVNPNPAIKGIHNQITVTSENSGLVFPTICFIKDARGMVVDKFEAVSNPFTHDIRRLEPAEYSLVLDPDGINEEMKFVVAKTGNDRIVVSPNPVFKDVDEKVVVKILNEETQDESFEVTVDDFEGRRYQSFGANSRSFDLDVSGLEIGSYILNVQGANSLFQENLELTMKGKPYLWVSPNPATSVITGQVFNPMNSAKEMEIMQAQTVIENQEAELKASYKVIIKDKMGQTVKETKTSLNPFEIELDDLVPDVYYMVVTDGYSLFNKIFSKL